MLYLSDCLQVTLTLSLSPTQFACLSICYILFLSFFNIPWTGLASSSDQLNGFI